MLKKYSKIILAAALSMGAFTSCEDFLTVLPTDKISEKDFWQDKTDLEGVRASAYQKLVTSNVMERIIYWGELRSDNLALNELNRTGILYLQQGTLKPTEGMFSWGQFYSGINLCNNVLEKGQEMVDAGRDPSFREADFKTTKAEITALRGLYYFYLVRAFRNVPYVTSSVSTDDEAQTKGPVAKTNGEVILGDQIAKIEEYMNYAAINYGSLSENKGRFTRMGIRALLADMYLWRGCMLQNRAAKERREGFSKQVNLTDVPVVANGDTTGYTLADGAAIDEAYYKAQSDLCFQKAIDYSQEAIDLLKSEYLLKIKDVTDNRYKEQPYPLLQNVSRFSLTEDNVYNEIFGDQNSTESIFEVQFDGSQNVNSALSAYYSKYDGSLKPTAMVASSVLTGGLGEIAPQRGFGQTDFRAVETFLYAQSGNSSIVKGLMNSLIITNYNDVKEGVVTSFINSGSSDFNWPVYRLTDVMLIKAEAIARKNPEAKGADLRDAFNIVNLIYARNNPGLHPSGKTNEGKKTFGFNLYDANEKKYLSDRLSTDYCLAAGNSTNTDLTAKDLLLLIYNERQREYVGEGKRWFDLVRQGEASYDAQSGVDEVFRTYVSVSNVVRNRLRNLNSLYCPINTEELKVNPALVQNPVWKTNE